MQIVYCDACGMRISPQEQESGAVLLEESKYICAKCAAQKGLRASPAKGSAAPPSGAAEIRKPSNPTRVLNRPASAAARSVKAEAHKAPVAAASLERGNKTRLVLGIGGFAAGIVVLLAGLFVSGGKKSSEPEAKTPLASASPAEAKAQPAAAPVQKPQPPPVTKAPASIPAAGSQRSLINPDAPRIKPAAPPATVAPAPAPAAAVASEPPPIAAPAQPQPAPAAPSVAAASPEPAVAPAPPPLVPAEKTYPAILDAQQRASLQAYSRAFEQLAKNDTDPAQNLEAAIRAAKNGHSTECAALLQALEKGQALHKRAIENITRNPPPDTVKITRNKAPLSGTIQRIEGGRAWIKSQGLEIPVEIAALPHPLLLKALALDENSPGAPADRAAYLFALGDTGEAAALCRRMKKEARPEWAALFDHQTRLERLGKFEQLAAGIEAAAKGLRAREAAGLLASLRKDFADLATAHTERVARLAERVRDSGLTGRLSKVTSAQIVRAEEDLSVELLYDFIGNPKCFKDFRTTNTATLDGGGLRLGGVTADQSKELACQLSFLAGALRVELLMDSADHDVYFFHAGQAQTKVRCREAGSILFTWEPVFTGDIGQGAAFPFPQNGLRRWVFERGPDFSRFLLDDTEHARQSAPPSAAAEKSWSFGLTTWAPSVIQRIIIKGRVDPGWLAQRTPEDGEIDVAALSGNPASAPPVEGKAEKKVAPAPGNVSRFDAKAAAGMGKDANPIKPGLWASYWSGNPDDRFKDFHFARAETKLVWDWKDGKPDPRVKQDDFGIRLGGLFLAPREGHYLFQLVADDYAEAWIDGKQRPEKTGYNLAAGLHEIKIRYLEYGGAARLSVKWKLTGTGGFDWQEIPEQALFHDSRMTEKYQQE